jgi:hypothetical protein
MNIGRTNAASMEDDDVSDIDEEDDDELQGDNTLSSRSSIDGTVDSKAVEGAKKQNAAKSKSMSSSMSSVTDPKRKLPEVDGGRELKKKAPSRSKPILNKSSAMARDEGTTSKENAKPRKTNPTNLIGEALSSVRPLRAMKPGTLKSLLHNSLTKSFPKMAQADRDLLEQHCILVIRTLVRVNTDLMRVGLLVMNLFTTLVFMRYPTMDGVDAEARQESFKYATHRDFRGVFFYHIVSQLLDWNARPVLTEEEKAKKPSRAHAVTICNIYKGECTKHRTAPPFTPEDKQVCSSNFLEQCAKRLSDLFAIHVYKYTSELRKRVRRWFKQAAKILLTMIMFTNTETFGREHHRFKLITPNGPVLMAKLSWSRLTARSITLERPPSLTASASTSS